MSPTSYCLPFALSLCKWKPRYSSPSISPAGRSFFCPGVHINYIIWDLSFPLILQGLTQDIISPLGFPWASWAKCPPPYVRCFLLVLSSPLTGTYFSFWPILWRTEHLSFVVLCFGGLLAFHATPHCQEMRISHIIGIWVKTFKNNNI